MRKRWLIGLVVSLMVMNLITPVSFAATQTKKIPVTIDGLPVVFDVQPVNQAGRVLVPFRAVAEALNVGVNWDAKSQTVTAANSNISVKLQIGNTTAYCNGTPVKLDVPARIIGGRTLIPLRFFSEAFNCKVGWDQVKGVTITSAPSPMTVLGYYALGDSKTSSWEDVFGKPYPDKEQGNTDIVSDLGFGWYSLDATGNLLTKSTSGWRRPDGWEDVVQAADTYALKTEMVVHLLDGDGTITKLLADEAAMQKAVAAIATEAVLYQGVDLDFEGLGLKEKGPDLVAVQNRFTRFVQLLSAELKKNNIMLTLSLHAPNSVYKGYNYKELGKTADRIVIMAYDYGTRPEPVDKVVQAVEMAKASVPANKLILGISVPNENSQSILTKVGIAKRYKLGGIALWRLGLVSDDMWNALRTSVQVR